MSLKLPSLYRNAFLKAVRQTPKQVFKAYSFSLNDAAASAAALEAACESHEGRNPDAMFLCAGGSAPGFFVEQTEASMRKGMDDGYWVQAWSALVLRFNALFKDFVHGFLVRLALNVWPEIVYQAKLSWYRPF